MTTSQGIEIEDLSVAYRSGRRHVQAVERVSLQIRPGRITAIVGESGSGKSTLARAILRLAPGIVTNGSVSFEGRDLGELSERAMRKVRGRRISMIFQNPLTSLNPLLSIRRQLFDTYRAHNPKAPSEEVETRVREVLGKLGIDESRLSAFPHELSGGMTQRVMIGMGLICGADFVIADEPTTSLDVLVEAAFLRTLHELCRTDDVGVVLVSHNMGLVAMWADDIAVMYAGRIVEFGPADTVMGNPSHPYTRQLVGATPTLDREIEELVRLGGTPPDLGNLPSGCAFHPRCPFARPVCAEREPAVIDLESAPGQLHQAACLKFDPASADEFSEVAS